MSGLKPGADTVVLKKAQDHATDTDDYGNPTRGYVYREIRWCLVTPARSSEPFVRNSPSITGSNLIAPPGTARDIESADEILTHWTKHPDGTYTGRRWEILGEVGDWSESVECLLRRLT